MLLLELGAVQGIPLAGRAADCLEIFNEAHSTFEERFVSMGPIQRGIMLVVWTAAGDEVIRIISARLATPRERELLHRHMEER